MLLPVIFPRVRLVTAPGGEGRVVVVVVAVTAVPAVSPSSFLFCAFIETVYCVFSANSGKKVLMLPGRTFLVCTAVPVALLPA